LLHIVERLEGLLGKLPAAIQKPVLHELTPLKELFLQQRPPRLLLAGSGRWPMPQVVNLLFNGDAVEPSRQMVFEIFRWQDLEIKDRGTVSVLDARGADDDAEKTIRGELGRASADAIIILSDGSEGRTKVKKSAENGSECVHWNDAARKDSGIVAIHVEPTPGAGHNGEPVKMDWSERIQPQLHGRVWGGFEFSGEAVTAWLTGQRRINWFPSSRKSYRMNVGSKLCEFRVTGERSVKLQTFSSNQPQPFAPRSVHNRFRWPICPFLRPCNW
jgi:hypothetical protein